MARGRGKKPGLKRHGTPNKHSKFKQTKKTTPFRDIKHTEQFRKVKPPVLLKRKEIEEDEVEEETPLDALQQLLSSFNGTTKVKNVAVESDESSEEEDEEKDIEEEVRLSEDDGTLNNEEVDEGSLKLDEVMDDMTDEEEVEIPLPEVEIINNDDPFHQHVHFEVHESVIDSISASPPSVHSTTCYWPCLHNLKIDIPKKVGLSNTVLGSSRIDKEREHAKEYSAPSVIKSVDLGELHIKTQLHKRIAKANVSLKDKNEILTSLQKELFSIINNYQDLYFPGRNFNNAEEIRFSYCLHAMNHILKTRLKVVHHNERLAQKDKHNVPDDFRDQGLVRPKVLILVPFRESCLRIVNTMADILLDDTAGNLINKARFMEEFSGSELAMSRKNPKPEDYEQLFKGNIDDTFRIGLTVTKKSLKLYSEFYSSDIIIASPLGLRMVIGSEGDKERDFDFLASIELLVLDQTDVFLMQNWDHLVHVVDHLHVQPRESHGTDFSRVRGWALNGWTKYYRQSLVFSSITTPEINALFSRKCSNYAGRVRVVNPVEDGSISQVVVPVPQVYNRFATSSVLDALDARFNFFTEKVLPQFKEPIMTGVLIYVPSYFDYVKIRNYLKRQDFNFVQICEYTKDGKVARARDMFFHNQAQFLLYSERFHFFRRVNLKGVKHIIFYQPPTFPHFYSELCNLLQESNQNKFLANDANSSVSVLYCKYDILQLAAIVKTSRAARMLASQKTVHMFTSSA